MVTWISVTSYHVTSHSYSYLVQNTEKENCISATDSGQEKESDFCAWRFHVLVFILILCRCRTIMAHLSSSERIPVTIVCGEGWAMLPDNKYGNFDMMTFVGNVVSFSFLKLC